VFAEECDHLMLATVGLTRAAESKSSGLLRDVLSKRVSDADVDVELWHQFGVATGWDPHSSWYYAADPYGTTLECARI